MPPFWLLGSLSAAICALSYYWIFQRARYRRKYFPSPPSEPILGHLRIFPQDCPWVTFTEWHKTYGDILHLTAAGKPIIVLNKAEDAYELLERRGQNYSDRPRSILHGELVGAEYFLSITRYGNDFRTMRRFITQYFNSRNHVSLYPLLEEQVKIMLKQLLLNPERFPEHLERASAGIVMKSTYGREVVSVDDPYVRLATEASSAAVKLGIPGLNPIDLTPSLRYVPTWFPGARLLRKAKSIRIMIKRMIEEPFQEIVAQRNLGHEPSCFVKYLLDDYEQSGTSDNHEEVLIQNAAAQIFGAATGTSTDTILTFILMMTLHPEVAKKAQAEIDKVVGTEQFPTLGDREGLPYVECVVKEILRINPAAPLGVPHASLEDDVYKGKVIPGGSFVVANIWGMMRDERYFPEPGKFNPDRFLSKLYTPENVNVHVLNTFQPDDPATLAFGFGRRACPGRFFAHSSAWLVIANILAAFDILPPIDPATGKETMPEFEWVGGLTAKPKPFNVRIVPRSEKHARLVQ